MWRGSRLIVTGKSPFLLGHPPTVTKASLTDTMNGTTLQTTTTDDQPETPIRACIPRSSRQGRHYFRRRGGKQIPLPGLPGSGEFMDAYQSALGTGGEQQPPEIGAGRSKPGTVAAAVAGYFSS